MRNFFKRDTKEKSKTSTAHEPTSNFSVMENIINRPYQNRPTPEDTQTAHELMPSSAPSASKTVNDVIQSISSLSGTTPSSSILVDPATLDHAALNEKEQSRICKTVTIGHEDAFDRVCSFLTSKEVGIVGIYGMGGVGKTTLMKKVCYEFLKPTKFKVIWIVVSRTINEENIQKSMMTELGLGCRDYEDPQTRAIKINEALYNEGSQTALILDDIWDAIDLEELGIAGGLGLDGSMFKIIFTTRSEDVCLQMRPDQMIRINCLGPEESWVLFNRIVGEKTLYFHDRIPDLAREVANECGGLPLALTVIGKAMVCKTSVGAWENALKNLRNRSSMALRAEKNLYERLKFSYDNLENQVERECFLFCCLYPEDEKIDICRLIDCWIGEGLLDVTRYDNYQESCNTGHNIVDTLVAKSLIQATSYLFHPFVTIHDVIRDMGLWIGSEKKLFVHIDSLKSQGKEIAEFGIGGRWAYVNDSIQELCCSSELSVLHMEGHNSNTNSKTTLSSSFFRSLSFMHNLKVLILRYVHWECFEIPPSTLGLLVELRHLEISYSDLMELPPDIGNLTKLLVLQLMHDDKLTTLPETIGDLCELRKLQIRSYSLTKIPSELEKLKKLEIVEIHLVKGMVWFDNFNHFTKLRRLALHVERLEGDLPCLDNLEELLIQAEVKQETALMKDLIEFPFVKLLLMSRWSIASGDELITALDTMQQLRKLHIEHSPIGKFVTTATTHDFLPQLKSLYFVECPELQKIHISEKALHSLEVLKIIDSPYLKAVAGLQYLQQLRVLYINAEGIIFSEKSLAGEHCLLPDLNNVCFPNLQRLVVKGLHEINCICNDAVAFPSLVVFELRGCPMLEKLPRGLMNINRKLKGEIIGTEEWWDGLEWEDDDFKSYLLPLLRTDYFIAPMTYLMKSLEKRDEELQF